MMRTLLLFLALLPSLGVDPQTRPDFSGEWTFDRSKSLKQPGPDGRIVLAAMLGDSFVAEQDGRFLNLTIQTGGGIVHATYHLDGTESRNMSPGEILVISRAMWDADRLVIVSTSTNVERGRKLTIDTRRVLWIDSAGDLIIERSGTPVSEVTASRSVYRRVKR